MIPPPVARVDGAVMVSGPALIHNERALRLLVAGLRRDGASSVPAILAELYREVRLAAESFRAQVEAGGHADIEFSSPVSISMPAPELGAWMTTPEVAARLKKSERHVRRLADEIGFAWVSGRRVFDRTAVEAFAAGQS